MKTVTVYRIINKSDNVIISCRAPSTVHSYLLGRRLSNFIVIKSVGDKDTIVTYDGKWANNSGDRS